MSGNCDVAPTAAELVDRLRSAAVVTEDDWVFGRGLHTPHLGFLTVYDPPPALSADAAAVSCLGVDVGATMTRILVGVAPAGAAEAWPVLVLRYLTGEDPADMLEQLAESGKLLTALGCPPPAAVALGIAGPVTVHEATISVELSNKPDWIFHDFASAVRSVFPRAAVRARNDLTTGIDVIPAGRWAPLLHQLSNPVIGTPSPARTEGGTRVLKCHAGTGINIAVREPDGAVRGFEFGHLPYPALNSADAELAGALRRLYRRSVVTFEDLLGGRGLGPLVIAQAAVSAGNRATGLPAPLAELLRRAAGPERPEPGDESAVEVLRHLYPKVVGHAERYLGWSVAGDDAADVLLASFERFGLWFLPDMLDGDWPFVTRLFEDYGLRLAQFVLCAAQMSMCDVVYLAGRLALLHPVPERFVQEYRRLAPEFRHGRRLTERVRVECVDEPAYEEFLLAEAAQAVRAEGVDRAAVIGPVS